MTWCTSPTYTSHYSPHTHTWLFGCCSQVSQLAPTQWEFIEGLFSGFEIVWNWKWPQFHFLIIFDDIVEYFFLRFTQLKKQGSRTEHIVTFGLNVTTQNLHSVQLFANTKRANSSSFEFWGRTGHQNLDMYPHVHACTWHTYIHVPVLVLVRIVTNTYVNVCGFVQ